MLSMVIEFTSPKINETLELEIISCSSNHDFIASANAFICSSSQIVSDTKIEVSVLAL